MIGKQIDSHNSFNLLVTSNTNVYGNILTPSKKTKVCKLLSDLRNVCSSLFSFS